jgi:hypothetical protein
MSHVLLAAAVMLALFGASPARATCTSPNGNAGDVIFSSLQNLMVYCNGTSWISMGVSSSISYGTLTTGDFCIATGGTQISCTTATVNLSSQASGTLQAAQFPILTGDVTTTGGSLVTTVGSIGGKTVSLGGNLTISGAYAVSLTATGATSLTLPTSGTLLSTTSTIGTSQISGVIPIANGGTNTTAQTVNGVLYFNGSSITSGTALVFSGGDLGIGTATMSQTLTVNGNIDAMGANGYLTEIANNGSTATVLNKLAKLASGASTATVTTTSDTDGVIGIVVGNAGTSGNAQIAVGGQASCIFDGTTVAGDFVTISSTVGGDCHDTGSTTRSNTSQTIGRVMTVNSGTGTAATVEVALNGAGGGVPAGTTGQVQFNSGSSTFAASSNATFSTANNQLVVGTGAYSPVGTSGNVASVVLSVIPQTVTPVIGVASGGLAFSPAVTGQMAYYAGASTIGGTPNLYVSGSNIGIGTSVATNLLSLNGASAQTIWMERGTSAGNNLTVKAGGGLSGGTNQNGGNLILSSGISTGTGTSQIQFQTYPIGTSGTADNTATTAMTVASTGGVGIGTMVPNVTYAGISTVLDVVGSTHSAVTVDSSAASTVNGFIIARQGIGKWILDNDASDNFNIYSDTTGNQSNRLTVSQAGYVGIGTTGPNNKLDINGGLLIRGQSGGTTCPSVGAQCINYTGGGTQYGLQFIPGTDSTNAVIFYNASSVSVGAITTTSTTTTYNTTSDRRLKENIAPTARGLDALMKIEPDDFNFISDPDKNRVQGFIAQDLYKIYPEAVSVGGEDPKNKPWAVDYGRLTPLLVKAVQELKAINDNQAKTIDALRTELTKMHDNDAGQIQALTARLDALEPARR